MTSGSPKELALGFLEWNRRHLTAKAALTEAAAAERFARRFEVRANGRIYPADQPTYKAFLDGFRANIESIDYQVHNAVEERSSAVLAMSASIQRIDGTRECFEAMLLIPFDAEGRVTLWHEVYVSSP